MAESSNIMTFLAFPLRKVIITSDTEKWRSLRAMDGWDYLLLKVYNLRKIRMTRSLNEGGTAVHVALRLVVLSFILLVFSKWYQLRNN